jgi:hypothetical protein
MDSIHGSFSGWMSQLSNFCGMLPDVNSSVDSLKMLSHEFYIVTKSGTSKLPPFEIDSTYNKIMKYLTNCDIDCNEGKINLSIETMTPDQRKCLLDLFKELCRKLNQ